MGLLNWLLGDNKESRAIEDLYDFEEENDMLLPDGWTPEMIAYVEATGKIVNLITGKIEEPLL